jgi:hypothetical protein
MGTAVIALAASYTESKFRIPSRHYRDFLHDIASLLKLKISVWTTGNAIPALDALLGRKSAYK